MHISGITVQKLKGYSNPAGGHLTFRFHLSMEFDQINAGIIIHAWCMHGAVIIMSTLVSVICLPMPFLMLIFL